MWFAISRWTLGRGRGVTIKACLALIAASSVHLLFEPCVWAGDLSHEPVGARITLAKDRILLFTDAVARQASAAYPLASATNPAADDFVREPPVDYLGYGLLITSNAFFNSGGVVNGNAGIGAVRLPEAGTITVGYVRLESHDGHSRQGDDFVLRSNEVLVGYCHRVEPYLAVGGEILLTDSSLRITQPLAPGFDQFTESDTTGIGFDVGVTMALHETFLVGLHGGVKWDRTHTDGQAELPGLTIPIQLRDTTQISEVRFGVGWRPDPKVGLYADVQYVHLEDDFGTTEVGRIYVGVEYLPIEQLALRLSTVLDTQPEAGLGVGVGYYGLLPWVFEAAYTYNTFSEVRKEFGRANLISLSVVILF